MMKNGFALLGIILNIVSFAQVLPAERAVDWSIAGLKSELPTPTVVIDFEEAGGIGDGIFSNNLVFETILTDNLDEVLQINFPEGDFFFDSTLYLPNNIILNGSGADATLLLFDLDGANGDLIRTSGSSSAVTSSIIGGVDKGDTFFDVVEIDSFEVGDWVQIKDYDLDNVVSDWAYYNTGQILQIKEITGDQIELDSPLRRDYDSIDEPFIVRLNMTENVGIQNLKIKREDDAEIGQGSNIHFYYTVNSYVNCVESELTVFAHVRIDFSSNCEVSGSYFYDGHDYGGGGRAYGVVCQLTTGECLVQDNNFNHLRHAMLLQAGANGNVYAYNYSRDAFWTELPSDGAGDLVLHGNYVYANLFEGNIVQNLVIDHSHGINGPYNTFLRNRAELYGIFMNNSPASDSQNFIGNEIPNTGFLLGLYAFEGTDHFKYGNNHRGENKPPDTEDLTDESYYLSEPLPYFDHYSSWPPIGYPNALEAHNNEAFNNYNLGYHTQCENLYEDVGVEEVVETDAFLVYPNPSNGVVRIETNLDGAIGELIVYDFAGILIATYDLAETYGELNLENLTNGIYYLLFKDYNKILKLSLVN